MWWSLWWGVDANFFYSKLMTRGLIANPHPSSYTVFKDTYMLEEVVGQMASKKSEKNDEANLPELVATVAQRSPEQLFKMGIDGKYSPDMGIYEQVGQYTVVVAKDSTNLEVYDQTGHRVEGLSNTGTRIIDWTPLKKKENAFGTYWIMALDKAAVDTIGGNERNGAKTVDQFPRNLQSFIREYILQYGQGRAYTRIPDDSDSWQIFTGTIESIRIKKGEGYILFLDLSRRTWIGFQTQDQRGVELPPRNWVRYDTLDQVRKTVPANISIELPTVTNPDISHSQDIRNGYNVVVRKDQLLIVESGMKDADPKFTDKLGGIGNNVCRDPNVRGVIYYCTTQNPRNLIKLDTTSDSTTWRSEVVDFPKAYKKVANLSIDSTGNFITFQSEDGFVILNRDNLQELKVIKGVYEARLTEQGKIQGISQDGRLVFYDVNFQEVSRELDQRRVARLARGLATDLFRKETGISSIEEESDVGQFGHLAPVKEELTTAFITQIDTISVLQDMSGVLHAMETARTRLRSEGLQQSQIDFLTRDIQNAIAERERLLAAPEISQLVTKIKTKLSGSLSIASLFELKAQLTELKSLENLADESLRAQIREIENQCDQQTTELYRREGATIVSDAKEMVKGARSELENIKTMSEFSDWQEFRLPQLVTRLQTLARDMPIEASDTQAKILEARRELLRLSKGYEASFTENYAAIREKASRLIGEQVELVKLDIDSLVKRLRAKNFTDRAQAELYLNSSPAYESIQAEIVALKQQNPDLAKQLERDLRVQLTAIMYESERGTQNKIAETGQQMVVFGNTQFPKWEAAVQEKTRRQVDLTFIPDEKTKGPGVTADKIMGEIGILETNSTGKSERRRLFQDLRDEDEWRYGSISYRGEYVSPSYMSQGDYREFKQSYLDWTKGSDSEIKRGVQKLKQAMRELYKQRQPVAERTEQEDAQWREDYTELIREYATFVAKNHVLLLSRLDQIRNAPEIEFKNGSGYVPGWQSHWTVDQTTEHYLEEMAKDSSMQLELQEGLLVLKGHAGTGKDVLVKMFCNRTNRPYFSIDCSKWTTEFELSEDVVLEAADGASQTVKVPSVVLNAITTPGAVMYFNEINAMPEQAQIFLHGLMDEKRTLTLKTSSGKAVKAVDSVLLMASMNPGYPGTFDPQFATKSRMVGLEIDYPSLFRAKEPADINPNPPISAAEALRVARQVDSLMDFTYEPDPRHNEFVQIWERYINGIQNGAPDLSQTQTFDINVILTMVEFAHKLRQAFIQKFEKTRASSSRGALLVGQPITGREMRRMAYWLSKMSPEEKLTADPEAVARELFDVFFLSHIDKKDERADIRTAMATWTSSKRPAA